MGRDVLLLLGSNLGDRALSIRNGIAEVERGIRIAAVSRLYESPPWGRPDQPRFLNAALRGETSLSPDALLGLAKAAEERAGRVEGERWGPRVLDVDILLMGDLTVDLPHLRIPHPLLAVRRFALVPAAEIAPDAAVPPGPLTIRDLLSACPDTSEVKAS